MTEQTEQTAEIEADKDGEKVFCKCGCGRKLSKRQLRYGGQFASNKCFAKYNGKQKKGKHYKTEYDDIRDVDYSKGTIYCITYNDEDIKCVMCYEQNKKLPCRVRCVGRKNEPKNDRTDK